MKCYYHNESDAVGFCKACTKGLCTECAVDVGYGLACKDTCEDQVRAVNANIERGKKGYKLTAGAMAILGIVLLLMGSFRSYADFIFFGIVCLLIAVLYYRFARKPARPRG